MKHADDLRLARDALAGDAAAASRMQDEYFGMVRRILMARGLNPTNASDLVADLAADWAHAYSREQAAYPVAGLYLDKFWAPVSRVDNVFGDRNLICSCPPPEAWVYDPDEE